jgi:AGCS family alanine or glycine:cation symporter
MAFKTRGRALFLLVSFLLTFTPLHGFAQGGASTRATIGATGIPAPQPPPDPTLEETVDGVFGELVGVIATVFFWDLIFWDNDAQREAMDPFGDAAVSVYADPLGWGLWVQHEDGVSLASRDGAIDTSYDAGGELAKSAVTMDGRFVALGDVSGGLRVYARSGDAIWSLPEVCDGGVLAMEANPHHKDRIAIGCGDGTVAYWRNAGDASLTRHVGGGAVSTLDWHPDGAHLLVGRSTGVAEVWKDGAILATFPGGLPLVSVDFNDAGTRLLTGSADGHVTVLDAETGQIVRAFQVAYGVMESARFIADAQILTLGMGKADTWDLEQGSVSLEGKGGSYAEGVAQGRILEEAGERLAVIGEDGKVTLWIARKLSLPLIVLWLVFGAVFFTVRMRFVNFRLFGHAIKVVKGTYDDPADEGEVSHFQALSSALSATVGLGNIAGVAIAVSIGGPGATFWMVVAGLLGMASKFSECTLGQKYRTVSPDGEVMGGAMHYLSKGLAEKNMPVLGKVLAVMFALLCIGGSFGGGNTFQVKQSLAAVEQSLPWLADYRWIYGLLMTGAVGVVILGGIKRIAQTAEKIVPTMCGLYVAACFFVIVMNFGEVGSAIGLIFSGAFAPDALYGGAIGVLVVGFQRAAFSNEAGIGSAAIAHAAAKTKYPVREGVVALLEPFIDTVVVCTMTALVIVITGAYDNPEYGTVIASREGAALTSLAMGESISWFPTVLSVAVVLFAYSTMISWSYYGERCWTWLFGAGATLYYRLLFLVFVFLGSIITATNVLDFSDLMILGMAVPNILGVIILSGDVRSDLDVYEEKLEAGEFKVYGQSASSGGRK